MQLTLVCHLADQGKMPRKILNMSVGRSLNVVYDLKRYFQRNGLTVDKEFRQSFINYIPKTKFTGEQKDFVEEELQKVKLSDEKWKPLAKDSNSFVKLSKIHVEGETIAWGKGEAIIDTSAEEVRATKTCGLSEARLLMERRNG